MPDTDGAGVVTPADHNQTPSTEPLWKRRGFKDEAGLEAALEEYSKDTPALRKRLKDAEEKAKQFDELAADRDKKKQAEMTETERLAQEVADLKSKHQTALSELNKRDQALLFERTAASRLAGAPAQHQRSLRRLYETVLVTGFSDGDELNGKLDAIDAEWLADNPVSEQGAPRPDLSRQPAVGSKVTGGSQAANMPGGTYDAHYLEALDRKMSNGGNRRKA